MLDVRFVVPFRDGVSRIFIFVQIIRKRLQIQRDTYNEDPFQNLHLAAFKILRNTRVRYYLVRIPFSRVHLYNIATTARIVIVQA